METNTVSEEMFTDDSVFVVREDRGVDFFIGGLFIVLTLFIIGHIVTSYHSDEISIYYKLALITVIPAISFIMRGIKNKIAITIDKSGIYRSNKLLTDWNHFISAKITQDEITGSYQDNFVLLIGYQKEGDDGSFLRKIKISNTWDKSEEEMIAAVRYFTKFSNKYNAKVPE